MKRFKCKVIRIDEYEIEFDESKINNKWLSDFRSYMYKFHSYEEHAEHLAQLRARCGEDFYEGYGYISVDGKKPLAVILSKENESFYEPGINIRVVSEDRNCNVEVEKLL